VELYLHSPSTPSWLGARLKRAQGQVYRTLPDGGECSALRPGTFTAVERVPGTHWIGLLGLRAGLDVVAMRKIPFVQLVT